MAREKDYLDALTIAGITVMLGPFVMQVLLAIITGSSIPPGLDNKDAMVIAYIGGFFFYTGLLMLLYVAVKRFMEGYRGGKT